MVLFKKQKIRLRSFLEKHEGNLFIFAPTCFAVGLINALIWVICALIVSVPIYMLVNAIGPGWVIGLIVAIGVVGLLGLMLCTSIRTNPDYKENKTLFD